METKFKYTPEIPEVFRCRVPLPGTSQAFLLNGVLTEEYRDGAGVVVLSEGEMGFRIAVPAGSSSNDSTQIITVRDNKDTSPITFSKQHQPWSKFELQFPALHTYAYTGRVYYRV